MGFAGALLGGIEKAELTICTYREHIWEPELVERTMKVQFNPSSIRYFASSEPIIIHSYRQQKLKDMRLQQQAKPVAGQFAFQLIFDEVQGIDAFMGEKAALLSTTPSPTAVLKGGGSGLKNLLAGPPSVRAKLCALTSLIVSKQVVWVEFKWGELRMRGTVSEIQTNFSMFSTIGEPIRGTVQMRIAEDVSATNSAGVMNKAFQSMFKDNVSDARSVTQKAGNILNLNI